ncbi:MAG TPA: triphosphoribosyl-dephospho-CoA synthase, partial [Clostridia bacterium]|nr:triphosphoribosyl-dephospho-CoA synthase [Clostridia bacterium]
AAAGFPTVMGHGLPALDEALGRGLTRDEAGTRALLVIMLKAEDTVLLRRAGEQGAREALARVKAALDSGARPYDLLELDQYFISEGLSPGGSADLLAASFFVSDLRELLKEQ